MKDNLFDEEKAIIIYSHISRSGIREFMFVNEAGAYDWNGVQYSNFDLHVQKIRMHPGLRADVRWESIGLLG